MEPQALHVRVFGDEVSIGDQHVDQSMNVQTNHYKGERTACVCRWVVCVCFHNV
jgi:hypothetical protein